MSDIQEGCGDLPQRRHARRTGLIAGTALAGIAGMFIAVAPGHATPVTSISMAEETSDVAAFYTPPEDRLVGAHGSVIQLRPIDGDPGVEGARNYLVLYRSVDMRGGSVAVSGTLAVPDGQAPPGGWPLISWAHGTTGVDDSCAPSHDTSPDFPAHDYTSLVRKVQAQWIAAGYAVAQTDYQGLGTPGPHGYLIGTAEQRAVTDMARAARKSTRRSEPAGWPWGIHRVARRRFSPMRRPSSGRRSCSCWVRWRWPRPHIRASDCRPPRWRRRRARPPRWRRSPGAERRSCP